MKIVTVIGARPQFIKAAPVSSILSPKYNEIIIHTGQHYDHDLSEVFFKELGIPEPKYNLAAGSGSHGWQTAKMVAGIEAILMMENPDIVLVYGDTNSTLAGALAASKLHIPIAHVEAGVRTYDMRMPEEVNRVVTDRLASFLFCPTETAVNNLKLEGYSSILGQGQPVENMETLPDIYTNYGFGIACNVGDVMYDAALMFAEIAFKESGILGQLGLQEKNFVLATIHRPQNTDRTQNLAQIINGLVAISEETTVVFPVHPRTRKALANICDLNLLKKVPSFKLTRPVSYLDMIVLESSAAAIITDSGGVQHEAAFYRVPCVTILERTPWIETVNNNWNRLCPPDKNKIIEAYREAINSNPSWDGLCSCYGTGDAAKKIIGILEKYRPSR
ncbi:UDP-N-acetyl glucosamine 2-epimerase [Desulfallas sp. Bu1-1]|uniref:UDP-N-acetyl glucosamine 2-epimerase n=1 Tax=Desulfallas sp. Bu1-1 TaxID=2787620 RepID=UPI00189F1A9C|nr:UDP-N-acetyl glucosamine 2-epimerase [Desulfallas sp. Bu1-1]MBF7081414.1 UDP-N-acetyl glucosamine 2-epimerase [Desulfallas sp. Bu1-1]